MKRHADDVTVAELIRLRMENDLLQQDNKVLSEALAKIYWTTDDVNSHNIAAIALNERKIVK